MYDCAFSRSDLSTNSGPLLRQTRREQDGGDHALRIRDSLARDVERGPMIDRRAYDRQPECDVHCLAERRELHRDETLVVIARDDHVELTAPCTAKQRS